MSDNDVKYVFIDDSGDPGFKLRKGSSRYFVIVCVVVASRVDLEQIRTCVEEYKRDLGWGECREVKFHRTNDAEKIKFFQKVDGYDFEVYYSVIDKEKDAVLRSERAESVYLSVILDTLALIEFSKVNLIFLDGSGSKSLRRAVATKARQALKTTNNCKISLKLVDSRSNLLIQLADMCAGGIMTMVDEEKRVIPSVHRILRRHFCVGKCKNI